MKHRESRRASTRSFAAVAALLAGLLGAGALRAQDGPASVFGEVIDVRVVNIEAVVTGKDGLRVEGLGPDDFLLLVDGAEVPIEYFTEIRGGHAVPRREPGATVDIPAVSAEGTVGTSFLVFIDDYLSVKRDRDRALERVIEQLPVLAEGDRMAVVAFDGGKLEMLSSWSTSTAEIRRTLEGAKKRSTRGLQREALIRRPRLGGEIGRLERRHAGQQLSDQMKRVILASTAALRSFASPPGRKAMLLLAGGWPYNPYELVMTDPWGFGSLYETGQHSGPRLYQPLYDTANRLGYTLYMVDVPGFRADGGVSAENRTLGEARQASRLSTNRESTEGSTLRMLADQTGGRAFLNATALGALEQAVQDTRAYYWLGFTPEWRGENRRHRIQVRTRDAGLEVRTRRSFSDLSRQTEVTMMAESALLLGDELRESAPTSGPGSAGNLRAALGEAEGSGFRKILVPLEVWIPLDELTFLPSNRGWSTRVELRIVVEDKHGDRNDIAVLPLSLDHPREPEPGDVGHYETQLKMRKLEHDLVVSIHDPPSGRMLWTLLKVDP